MSCWIDAQIEEEGAITVPARLLADFVNTLPNDRISLTVAPASRQVRLVCARNEATIGGLDAEDFPPAPVVKDGVSVSSTPRACARRSPRPCSPPRPTTRARCSPASTRSSRATCSPSLLPTASGSRSTSCRWKTAIDEPTEIVVPARALQELNRLLGDEDEPVTLRTNAAKTQVLFRLKNVEMVAQLIQGTFPNFSQLIPASYTSRAIVEVGEFLRETRIASVFARDGSGIVRLVVTPGEGVTPGKVVDLSPRRRNRRQRGRDRRGGRGRRREDRLQRQVPAGRASGPRRRQLAMETTGPSSQGVFKPVGNDDYVHVIMPMFVQW